MSQIKLTTEDLTAALVGFELERDRLAERIAEIKKLLGSGGDAEPAQPATGTPRKKRSAAVRKKMKLAQQLRWEKIRNAAKPQELPAAKPKRTMSAGARKRIAAAQKRRWAVKKAAEAKPGKAQAGKTKPGKKAKTAGAAPTAAETQAA